MKIKIVLLAALAYLSFNCNAQVYNAKNKGIYNVVKLGFDQNVSKQVFVVLPIGESTKTLKNFNFQHPNYTYLDTTKLNLNTEWLTFLRKIDTTKIISGQPKSLSKYFANKSVNYHSVVRLSPQIISAEANKAIVAYDTNNTCGVILLQKYGSKWMVIKIIRTAIS